MKSLLILIMVAFIATGCTKSGKSTTTSTYMNTGTITGPDYGMTPCSGGYLITISGITGPTRFSSLPSGTGIDLTSFPVHVKLNWHYESANCHIITIDAIEKAD